MVSLFFVFVFYVCVKSITNLLWYNTIEPIVLAGYLG